MPHTSKGHRLFEKSWIRAHRDVLEWEEVIGSLKSATIKLNFHSTLDLKLTRLLSWGVQSVTVFQHHAHCTVGKTGDFPDLKITTSK